MTILFVLFNLLENHFYFGKEVRKFISLSYLITELPVCMPGFYIPCCSTFKLGKLISHEEAAKNY